MWNILCWTKRWEIWYLLCHQWKKYYLSSIFIFWIQKSFEKSLKTSRVAPLSQNWTKHLLRIKTIDIKYHRLHIFIQKRYLYMLHWYERTKIGNFHLVHQKIIINISMKKVIWMVKRESYIKGIKHKLRTWSRHGSLYVVFLATSLWGVSKLWVGGVTTSDRDHSVPTICR